MPCYLPDVFHDSLIHINHQLTMFRISGDLLPPLDAPSEYFTRAATLRIIMYKCRLKYSAEIWREGHNTLILQTYWLTYLMIF